MAHEFTLGDLSHPRAALRPPSGFALLLRLEAWLDRRAGRRAALALDDRALADLGLSRADAERAAEGLPSARRGRR